MLQFETQDFLVGRADVAEVGLVGWTRPPPQLPSLKKNGPAILIKTSFNLGDST